MTCLSLRDLQLCCESSTWISLDVLLECLFAYIRVKHATSTKMRPCVRNVLDIETSAIVLTVLHRHQIWARDLFLTGLHCWSIHKMTITNSVIMRQQRWDLIFLSGGMLNTLILLLWIYLQYLHRRTLCLSGTTQVDGVHLGICWQGWEVRFTALYSAFLLFLTYTMLLDFAVFPSTDGTPFYD